MDLGQLPDIIRRDVLKIDDMPDRAKEVLGLRALGLGSLKIARILKCKRSTVDGYLERYDPEGLCRVTAEQKRVITTEMLMSIGVESLLEITDEKLKDTDANGLASIATRCITAAERIRALDAGVKKQKSDLDSAMEYFDAEFEVEGE